MTETEYRYAPLRIFDLKPGLDGVARTIRRPISAWTADWRNLVHNHEVRWPYVVRIWATWMASKSSRWWTPSIRLTVAYYDTYLASGEDDVMMGAWGIDVRNADGLIVLSDMVTGFWGLQDGGLPGVERSRLGRTQHLERPRLGERAPASGLQPLEGCWNTTLERFSPPTHNRYTGSEHVSHRSANEVPAEPVSAPAPVPSDKF